MFWKSFCIISFFEAFIKKSYLLLFNFEFFLQAERY